jgi:hypothetical protein
LIFNLLVFLDMSSAKRKITNDDDKENARIQKMAKQFETKNEKENVITLSSDESESTDTDERHIIGDVDSPNRDKCQFIYGSREVKTPIDNENIVTIKKELELNKESAFTCGGICEPSLSDPQLFIKKFGLVNLPIMKTNGEKILKICNQAPYGKGMKTVVNKNVRDTFQLNPDEFELRNPKWEENIKQLVDKVSINLNCNEKTIEAKLYKLLIYKTGGHFKPHRDTEKEDNMIATLSIQLPSLYSGGELIVHTTDKKVKYDFNEEKFKSQTNIMSHYTCHYADLLHEVSKVKSGYRTVLVYSLYRTDNNPRYKQQKNENEIKNDKLVKALNNLSEEDINIGFLLEHKYTNKSISGNGIHALKSVDKDRLDILKSANDQLQEDKKFEFHIALVELHVAEYEVTGHYEGYWDHRYYQAYYEDEERDEDDEDDEDRDEDEDEKQSSTGSQWEVAEDESPEIKEL